MKTTVSGTLITIEDFIDHNRQELTDCIRSVCGNCLIDDEEIELWIMNDESLYNWVRSEGVEI